MSLASISQPASGGLIDAFFDVGYCFDHLPASGPDGALDAGIANINACPAIHPGAKRFDVVVFASGPADLALATVESVLAQEAGHAVEAGIVQRLTVVGDHLAPHELARLISLLPEGVRVIETPPLQRGDPCLAARFSARELRASRGAPLELFLLAGVQLPADFLRTWGRETDMTPFGGLVQVGPSGAAPIFPCHADAPRVVALVPAHNEESIIRSTIESLLTQTAPLMLIVIASDNSTDETVAIASEYSRLYPQVKVIETVGNSAKKAGALNQAVRALDLEPFDFVFQMDADSILQPDLIEEGLREMAADASIGGLCSSAFVIPPLAGTSRWGRLLWRLQNIEYGFAQAWRIESPEDSRVLAGIGSLLRVEALEEIGRSRSDGKIWDEESIVEDYVIGLAMKDLGWRIKPAVKMVLLTEAQVTVGNLWRQRLRWYTGTISEIRKRGVRGRHSRTELVGVLIALQLAWPGLNLEPWINFGRLRPLHTSAVISGGIELRFSLWMALLPAFTLVHNAYRLRYVRAPDKLQVLLALTVFPLDVYDTFQQVIYFRSTIRSFQGASGW